MLLRVPARQANSSHPPRTTEQPQACSIRRRSVTADALQPHSKRNNSCDGRPVRQTIVSATHHGAAASLLDWSESRHGSCGAKQRRRWAAFVGKQCSCECRPDTINMCALSTEESHTLARMMVKDSSRLRCKAMTKEATDFASKQLLQVPARQANSSHPPRTEEQPQACSIGRRSVTAAVQSKEEGGVLIVSKQPLRVPAR